MSDSLPIIGIAGFGVEGRALFDYFQNKAEIHIFNETHLDSLPSGVTFHLGYEIPSFIKTLHKSPGIPARNIICKSPETKVSTLMDLVLEKVGARAIGVTGTKGKSTVSSLIAHILEQAGRDVVLFGNIGVADMSLIDETNANRMYVIELSSYQCEYLTHAPHIAILTNLYPEHIFHHGSFEQYREAKLNIARFQKPDDLFIDGSDVHLTFAGRVIHPRVQEKFETKLLGTHNQHNCAIALAAVEAVGVSEVEARKHIKTFSPLPYRLETVGVVNGRTFIDDSLATLPEATLASIEALRRVDTILLGGEDRGLDFKPFAKTLAATSIHTFVIFPGTGRKMVTEVQDRSIIPVSCMEDAVRLAYEHTPDGGTILLSNASPSHTITDASSSQNLFKDYKDKSAQYRKAIEQLIQEFEPTATPRSETVA